MKFLSKLFGKKKDDAAMPMADDTASMNADMGGDDTASE